MTLGHAGDSVADRYRLDRLVTGTGDVEHWEAYDTRLAREVAIRLEREPGGADEAVGEAGEGAAGDGATGEGAAGEAGDGAAEEAAAGEAGPSEAAESASESTLTRIARLTDPHVAALYDVGAADLGAARVRYAVSEWSAGHTLGDLMEAGPLPWPRVADWGRQTSAGLAALHAIGVAHGALTPESLAVFDDRRVKIMGAGLEHAVAGRDAAAIDVAAADDVRALGELMWRAVAGAAPVEAESAETEASGTAADAEAAQGGVEDADADTTELAAEAAQCGVDAAGATATGAGAAALAGRRLDIEPLREAGMPPVLIELLAEMLALDPAARPTAAAVEERIAPLVPIERAADSEAEGATMPLVVPLPGEFGTRTDMPVREYPTAPIQRGTPAEAQKRRPAGLLAGLALLLAAVGAAVGFVIANNLGHTTAPPLVDVTISSSAGTISLPTPTASSSSARPTTVTSAPRTSAAATSAPPSPSASPSPSPSASPSSSPSSGTPSAAGGGPTASGAPTSNASGVAQPPPSPPK